MIPARDPALRASPAAFLREPLFWAAFVAFTGATVGLAGTFWEAAVFSNAGDASSMLTATIVQISGETLVASSLFGILPLLGGPGRLRRATTVAGSILVLLLLGVAVFSVFYFVWDDEAFRRPPPFYARISIYAYWCFPPLIPLSFVPAALIRRRWRLGALLSGLAILAFPLVLLWILVPETVPTSDPAGAHWVLGVFGWGVSLPEAVLWAILGAILLREARQRALWRASKLEEKENRGKARRLYEAGLGRGDLSVVDEIVSEDFRDLRHGAKGKPGMERVISDLWNSFPDLAVNVEGQESEGDLVKTRLSLSGTDRGGVLWYPATERTATFEARFVDRFSGGELIEHGGETETGRLLRQLGLVGKERRTEAPS